MFPDDRKTDDMVYQYMFGQSFLVGIFSDSIYLPKGTGLTFGQVKNWLAVGNQACNT